MKRLEEVLGCTLLQRKQGHFVGLTEEGLRLLPRARTVLTAAEVAYQTAKGPKLSGRITVGILEDFSARRLPHLLALFQQTYPEVDVEVTSDLSMHLDDLISRKKLDLAILKRIHVPNNRSKNETSLFVEPLRWVAARDGALARDASVPLVLFPNGCVYRQQIIRALTDIDRPWHIAYTSYSYANVQSAISAGLGIGALPESAVLPEHSILGEEDGFPLLPDVEVVVKSGLSRQNNAARVLTKYLAAGLQPSLSDPASIVL
jgi:DNA-binding transcriptional LysR family regulator